MCVIIHLQPGYTPPFSMVENATHNNPHGYGLVVKRGNKLEVLKELPEAGNDPVTIYRLLKDNEDAERFLHLRWKTQGEVSYENTQPFTVFKSKKRHVEFMHNGTLGGYTNSYGPGNDQSQSDSKKFAEQVLEKFLPKLYGQNGVADSSDPDVQEILLKYWSTGNKGILITNDLDPFYLGFSQWETIKTSETVDGEEVTGSFFASNNTYFDRVQRGPLYESREAERKKREEQERQARIETSKRPAGFQGEMNLVSFPGFSVRYGISEALSDLLEDYDMYTPEGYTALANLTYHEMLKLAESVEDDDMASLLMYLTHFLKINTDRLTDVIAKNVKATEKIAEISTENKKLTEFIQGTRHAA